MSSGCEALRSVVGAKRRDVEAEPRGRFHRGMPLIFKLHIVNGLTIALVFPFTRLVNIWSVSSLVSGPLT